MKSYASQVTNCLTKSLLTSVVGVPRNRKAILFLDRNEIVVSFLVPVRDVPLARKQAKTCFLHRNDGFTSFLVPTRMWIFELVRNKLVTEDFILAFSMGKFKYKPKIYCLMVNRKFIEVSAFSIALISLPSAVYFWYKVIDAHSNPHESRKDEEGWISKESDSDGGKIEDDEPTTINLDDLITDDEHLTWCDGMKKALAINNPYSTTSLNSLIRDYAVSRGGELVVKDASALYSMMAAPKKKSECDDSDLEEKFVKIMIESHPKATNLMVGTVRSKYVHIVANENGSLSVSNLAGFDQNFSINL